MGENTKFKPTNPLRWPLSA